MTDLCTLYVTTATLQEAQTIADVLLEQHLIACANLLPSMTSMYRWNGATQVEDEVAMLLKTRHALAERATERIKELHSFEVPCIVVWPIESGSETYLSWVRNETQSPS